MREPPKPKPPCGCKGKRRKRKPIGPLYPERSRDPMVGEEVWTKPMVQDYIRRTTTAFDAVEADWTKADKLGRAPADELKRWRSFLGDWRAFVKDVDESWADMASVLAPFDARTATVQRIDQYRRELNTWAKRARAALGQKAPDTLKPSKSSTTAWWSRVGQEIAIGLAVAGATALVVTLVSGRR